MTFISCKICNNQMFQLKLNYYTNLCSKSVIVKLFYITKHLGLQPNFEVNGYQKSYTLTFCFLIYIVCNLFYYINIIINTYQNMWSQNIYKAFMSMFELRTHIYNPWPYLQIFNLVNHER